MTSISRAMLQRVCEFQPAVAEKSSVIHYGLETPSLAPAALPEAPAELLYLGRMLEEKGPDLALEAFRAVHQRHPESRLAMAGDGDMRASLARKAQTLGIADAVDFIGAVANEDVPKIINAATLVMVPSRWEEAFGLIAVEAALMARPVIATRVGALPELVLDGTTGRLVDRDDAAALAEAAIELVENPGRATEMGHAGRRRAVDQFSLERYADAYDREYQAIRDAAGASRGGE